MDNRKLTIVSTVITIVCTIAGLIPFLPFNTTQSTGPQSNPPSTPPIIQEPKQLPKDSAPTAPPSKIDKPDLTEYKSVDMLSELKPFIGYKNENIQPVKITGKAYNALIPYAPIYWRLDGKIDYFVFQTGCRDENSNTLEIKLLGDDKYLPPIPKLYPQDGLKEFYIPTSGIKVLQIIGSSLNPIINPIGKHKGALLLENGAIKPDYSKAGGIDLLRQLRPFKLGWKFGEARVSGVLYDYALLIQLNDTRPTCWNLEQKYSSISLLTGCNDETRLNGKMIIKGDGIIKQIIPKLTPVDGLKRYDIDVSGIGILSVEGDNWNDSLILEMKAQ